MITAAEELLDGSDQTIDCNPFSPAMQTSSNGNKRRTKTLADLWQAESHAREKRGDWGSITVRYLIQLLRPELMQSFADNTNSDHALLSYLLRDGIREYPFIPYDTAIH